jgi:hypothetical protein
MFRNLHVVGLGVGAAVQHNLVSLFHPQSIIKHINSLWRPPVRDIISGFEGVVLPGEMLRAYTSFTGFILAYPRGLLLTQSSWVVRVLDAAPF